MIRQIVFTCLGFTTSFGALACSDSVDDSPRRDLILIDALQIERAVANEPSLLFIDATLRNRTETTVNNFHDATVSAGSTRASFELGHNQDPNTLVGCTSPDPWDIRPGATKKVRMSIDLRSDPAVFVVACAFNESTPGIDVRDSRSYEAAREGAALGADFDGEVEIDLRATMNAECTPDDCPTQAMIRGSAEVKSP
jgi:hypothetical protein